VSEHSVSPAPGVGAGSLGTQSRKSPASPKAPWAAIVQPCNCEVISLGRNMEVFMSMVVQQLVSYPNSYVGT
jgi:hypothetical protein